MGFVNVILPGGRVVSVPEEEATTLRRETPAEATSRETAAGNEERSSGVGEGLKAFGEGLADTASFGIFGKVAGGADEEYARNAAIRGQERSGARGLGEIAAFVAPTGLLGDAAKIGSEVTGVGLAARAGEAVGGGMVGRAVEGGMLGAGAKVASTNVTGDPITVEGFLEGAGMGAFLQVGVGAIGDRITSKAWGAAKGIAEEDTRIAGVKDRLRLAQEGERIFERPPDSYEGFRDAHGAAQDAEVRQWKANEKSNDTWEEFNGSTTEFAKVVGKNGFQKTLNEIRARFLTSAPIADLDMMEAKGWTFEQLAANKEMTGQLLEEVRGDIETAGQMRRAGDHEGSMQALQKARAKLRIFEPEGISVPDLPDVPPARYADPRPAHVDVPKSFESFLRMKPETIERLAAELDPKMPEAEKLAAELGVAPGATAGETIAALHRRTGEYVRAVDSLKAQAEEEAAARAAASDAPASFVQRAQKYARKGAAFAAAAKVGGMIGGPFGYFMRPALGAMFGKGIDAAMGGAEDKILGGALIAGKKGLADKVRRLVAKYGEPVGNAINRLGPVTSFLGTSLLTGKKDSEHDPRKLAVRRIHEIQSIARSAPDTGFAAVDTLGMLGHPSDVGLRMHQAYVNAWAHLSAALPVDPGKDTTMFATHWLPSWSDTLAVAHRIEAVLNPLQAIARTLSGGGHPAAAQTLSVTWPGTMQLVAEECAFSAPHLADITYGQTSGHSTLFQTPMSGLSDPVTVTTLQALYMAPQIAAGGDQSRGTGNPTGRPPAVQSKLANTSVSNLIQ